MAPFISASSAASKAASVMAASSISMAVGIGDPIKAIPRLLNSDVGEGDTADADGTVEIGARKNFNMAGVEGVFEDAAAAGSYSITLTLLPLETESA